MIQIGVDGFGMLFALSSSEQFKEKDKCYDQNSVG
jgi:hypothetical protein